MRPDDPFRLGLGTTLFLFSFFLFLTPDIALTPTSAGFRAGQKKVTEKPPFDCLAVHWAFPS